MQASKPSLCIKQQQYAGTLCRFSLPPGMEISNLSGLVKGGQEAKGDSSSHIVRVFQEQVDASLTWEFVKWMRDVTKLPIFVKVPKQGTDCFAARLTWSAKGCRLAHPCACILTAIQTCHTSCHVHFSSW